MKRKNVLSLVYIIVIIMIIQCGGSKDKELSTSSQTPIQSSSIQQNITSISSGQAKEAVKNFVYKDVENNVSMNVESSWQLINENNNKYEFGINGKTSKLLIEYSEKADGDIDSIVNSRVNVLKSSLSGFNLQSNNRLVHPIDEGEGSLLTFEYTESNKTNKGKEFVIRVRNKVYYFMLKSSEQDFWSGERLFDESIYSLTTSAVKK